MVSRKSVLSVATAVATLSYVVAAPSANAAVWLPTGTDAWETPANWGAPFVTQPPGASDDADIQNGGTAVITTNVGRVLRLRVGTTGSSTTNQVILNTGANIIVGNIAGSTMSAFIGDGPGRFGTLTINGGTFATSGTGGVASNFQIGRNGGHGLIDVNGGTLNTAAVLAVINGTFDVSAGDVNIGTNLTARRGNVVISGGDVTVGNTILNGFQTDGNASLTIVGVARPTSARPTTSRPSMPEEQPN
ncbi:MAG: hypothetical protein HC888_04475 [Candidatus Competibacteraceae bacterium]|nr:hypothetical protein [Candidatus Competibacteraceae bacterium]